MGLDVHARSTHAAAIDRENGELTRARFGAGAGPVVEWLRALPQPIHGCYEAGPTEYALYCAAEAAGLRVDVVAPSKTPRAAADRVKELRELERRYPAPPKREPAPPPLNPSVRRFVQRGRTVPLRRVRAAAQRDTSRA